MPALAPNRTVPVETTLPGSTRRRWWAGPSLRSHSLVCLSPTKLYLAPAGASWKPEALKALELHPDLESAFGPMVTVIDLANVVRVQHDLLAFAVTLDFSTGTRGSNGSTSRLSILCGDGETSDAIFTKVWRRTSDRLALKPPSRDAWDLARAPVAFMAGVLAATLALAVTANALADASPQSAPSALAAFSGADWRWIGGCGGAVLACLQIWLYRRLTQPPTKLVLVRQPS